MIEDRNRYAPPSKRGIEGRSKQPCAKQIPNLGGLVAALFRGKDACNAGEVDAAEGEGEDGSPVDAGEGEVAQHVLQRERGCAEVEHLKREQGGDENAAKDRAAFECGVFQEWDQLNVEVK